MYRYLITTLFLTFSSFGLAAQSVDTLLSESKYSEAIEVLTPLAEEGNGDAQNKLGQIYHFGPSSIQDFKKARSWYLKAAQNKNGEAANHLGRLYSNGEGVEISPKKASYWYEQGMLLGDEASERNYYFSKNNPFFFVLDKALENDPEAILVAADFYHSGGPGIKKDLHKALLLYKKASSLGNQKANNRIASMSASDEVN